LFALQTMKISKNNPRENNRKYYIIFYFYIYIYIIFELVIIIGFQLYESIFGKKPRTLNEKYMRSQNAHGFQTDRHTIIHVLCLYIEPNNFKREKNKKTDVVVMASYAFTDL
jgi:hypothetical protein